MNSDTSSNDGPHGKHESIWFDTSPGTDYDALDGGLDVDVAVVGGGIAGITTAAKLRDRGESVALLERDRILSAVTGHTTAKLTSLHGLIYDYLIDHFGEEKARRYGEANEAAIDDIEATVEEHGIDCDFERTPAYTYLTTRERGSQERRKHRKRRKEIRSEVEAARRVGLPASFVEETDLPYDVDSAVRFGEQAHFHPRNYLLALAEQIPGDGGYLFEETTVQSVSGGRSCSVETDRGTVTADAVVVATHFPIHDHAFYFARLEPKRSYIVAARLNDDPPEGMYYEPFSKYFSVRPRPAGEGSMVLVGGQNHRTGHGQNVTKRYEKLESAARERFDVDTVEYRWSTQDYKSVDRVPFVGPLAPQSRNVYVATGFGGWGMTNGTAAGVLLADLVTGRDNPLEDVYRPTRLQLGASTKDLVSHNKHAAKHMAKDYVGRHPDLDLSGLGPGEGKVFGDRDDPIAVSRDENGEVHAVSAVCSHMGCLVSWNDGEKSWDCPCHGSRFDVDGDVLDTPAIDALDPVDLGQGSHGGKPSHPTEPDVPDSSPGDD